MTTMSADTSSTQQHNLTPTQQETTMLSFSQAAHHLDVTPAQFLALQTLCADLPPHAQGHHPLDQAWSLDSLTDWLAVNHGNPLLQRRRLVGETSATTVPVGTDLPYIAALTSLVAA